jgi:NAD(P)-dependent dehydrogenase (short-subunit alcohol dehydrogenase family)
MKPSRVIALTGVTRGLGRALAGEFIRLGHTVAGCGRTAGAIAELRREHGAPHDFAVVDVASDEQVQRWAARVCEGPGTPDLVVNNAALINRNAPLWQVSAAEFGQVIDVNLKGVANVIRHFVPKLLARQKGVIVNLSSGWGRSADAEVAPYCATKWAIEGLTQALAQELPPGLAAVALNPGIINTAMLQSCFGASAANYPTAGQWAGRAARFLLELGPANNGQALTAP